MAAASCVVANKAAAAARVFKLVCQLWPGPKEQPPPGQHDMPAAQLEAVQTAPKEQQRPMFQASMAGCQLCGQDQGSSSGQGLKPEGSCQLCGRKQGGIERPGRVAIMASCQL